MRRVNLFFACLVLLFLVFSGVVSAQQWSGFRNAPASSGSEDNAFSGITSMIVDIISSFSPIFEKVIGDTGGSEFFLAKILLMIIILIVSWVSLDQIELFSAYSWANWWISIAVSILAIRWIGDDGLIESIILPYSTLGVAITAAIPFLIFFFIVEKNIESKTFRRVAWIFFATIFIALWATRTDLGIGKHIYGWTAVASILVLILDGTIRRMFSNIKHENYTAVHNNRMINYWRGEMKDAIERHQTDGKNYISNHGSKSKTGEARFKSDMALFSKNIRNLGAKS